MGFVEMLMYIIQGKHFPLYAEVTQSWHHIKYTLVVSSMLCCLHEHLLSTCSAGASIVWIEWVQWNPLISRGRSFWNNTIEIFYFHNMTIFFSNIVWKPASIESPICATKGIVVICLLFDIKRIGCRVEGCLPKYQISRSIGLQSFTMFIQMKFNHLLLQIQISLGFYQSRLIGCYTYS